jgi:dTDP-4-dehydrorhamnose reductase
MKALILGGSGMLGHKLWQVLKDRIDTYVTLRNGFGSYRRWGLFSRNHTLDGVSAEDFQTVVEAVGTVQPTVVVNCIGIVKQAEAAKDAVASIRVNSLLPRRLARLCLEREIRLIHLSTDCVFSGRKGNYSESDVADPDDLYGKTKLLGEVTDDMCLTLRTSMIGRELESGHGLMEWFLAQEHGRIKGYRRAIFSGFTTAALSGVIAEIISRHQDLRGLYHVASEPISKYDLLLLVKGIYGPDIDIESDETIGCDRSLNGDHFKSATGFVAPSWPDMIRQMYVDPTPYTELRRLHACE